jgi:hypothetical protein
LELCLGYYVFWLMVSKAYAIVMYSTQSEEFSDSVYQMVTYSLDREVVWADLSLFLMCWGLLASVALFLLGVCWACIGKAEIF